MKQLTRISALCALLTAGACAAEGEPPVIDLGDAEDRLSDFAFAPRVTELRTADERVERAEMNVASAESGDGLVISGPLYLLDMPESGRLSAKVTTTNVIDWFVDDFQFMVLVEDDTGSWRPIRLFVEQKRNGIPTLSRLESFDAMRWEREDDRIEIDNSQYGNISDDGSGLGEYLRIGIFTIPIEGWGDLRGDYEYKLETSCNGATCVAEAAAPEDAPSEEPPSEEPAPGDGDPLAEPGGDRQPRAGESIWTGPRDSVMGQ